MDEKKINYLVLQSYKGNLLNEEKIHAIRKMLKRSDFKKYINFLKKKESEKDVIVVLPFEYTDKKMFEKMFPDKRIIYKIDSSLIAGIKIIDNDMIYELNLKNTLANIIENIGRIYD